MFLTGLAFKPATASTLPELPANLLRQEPERVRLTTGRVAFSNQTMVSTIAIAIPNVPMLRFAE